MNLDFSQKLLNTHPVICQDIDDIECGDGWYHLLDTMLNLIQGHVDRMSPEDGDRVQIKAVQIKEKFGELCFYHDGVGDDYIRGVVDFAVRMSRKICASTGSVKQSKPAPQAE